MAPRSLYAAGKRKQSRPASAGEIAQPPLRQQQRQSRRRRRKFHSMIDIQEEEDEENDTAPLPSKRRRRQEKQRHSETIMIDDDSKQQQDGSEDDSSLEIPYAMNLSQPLEGPSRKNKKRPRGSSALDSDSSCTDSDDDDDDDSSVGYESPPPSSQQEHRKPQPKENIRPGDVIDYQNTTLAVAGSSMGRGRAVVLATRPDNAEYPLILHNGAVLPASTPVQRVAEYRDGTLYPHHGQTRAISKFRIKNRQLPQQGDTVVTFATGLMQQTYRLQQLKQTVENEALKYLRGDKDNKYQHHHVDKTKKRDKQEVIDLQSSSSSSSSGSSSSFIRSRKDPMSQKRHKIACRRNFSLRPPIPSSFSPPTIVASTRRASTFAATRGKLDMKEPKVGHENKSPISSSGQAARDTAAALLQLRGGTITGEMGSNSDPVVLEASKRASASAHYDTDEEMQAMTLQKTRTPPRSKRAGCADLAKSAEKASERRNLHADEMIDTRSKQHTSSQTSIDQSPQKAKTPTVSSKKVSTRRTRDEFDCDSSSDDDLEFRLTKPLFPRSLKIQRGDATQQPVRSDRKSPGNELNGTSISVQNHEAANIQRAESAEEFFPLAGRRNGLAPQSDDSDVNDDFGDPIKLRIRRQLKNDKSFTPSTKSSQVASKKDDQGSLFKLKKQNNDGLSSGNKNLTDLASEDDSLLTSQTTKQKRCSDGKRVAVVANQSIGLRYQPLVIVDPGKQREKTTSPVRICHGGNANSPQSLMKAYKRLDLHKQKRRKEQLLEEQALSEEKLGEVTQNGKRRDKVLRKLKRRCAPVSSQEQHAGGRQIPHDSCSASSSSSSALADRPKSCRLRGQARHQIHRFDESHRSLQSNAEKPAEKRLDTEAPTSKKDISGRDNLSSYKGQNTRKQHFSQKTSMEHISKRVGISGIDLTSMSQKPKQSKEQQNKHGSRRAKYYPNFLRSSTSRATTRHQHELDGVPNRFELSSSSDDEICGEEASRLPEWSPDSGVDDPPSSSAILWRRRRKKFQSELRKKNDTSVFDFDVKNDNPQPSSLQKRNPILACPSYAQRKK
jgi:hypothetical protein